MMTILFHLRFELHFKQIAEDECQINPIHYLNISTEIYSDK